MDEFTKGKWNVLNVSDAKNIKIGVMAKDHQICGIEPGKSASGLLAEQIHLANARLIAASPDLYAACNLALHNEGKRWSEIRKVLVAALAKADKKGENDA